MLYTEDILFLDCLPLGIKIPPRTVSQVFRMYEFMEQVLHGSKLNCVTFRIEYEMTALFRNTRVEQNLDIRTLSIGEFVRYRCQCTARRL